MSRDCLYLPYYEHCIAMSALMKLNLTQIDRKPQRAPLCVERSDQRRKQSHICEWGDNHRSHLKEAAPPLWERSALQIRVINEGRKRKASESTHLFNDAECEIGVCMQLSHASLACADTARECEPTCGRWDNSLIRRPDYSHLLIIALLKLASI